MSTENKVKIQITLDDSQMGSKSQNLWNLQNGNVTSQNAAGALTVKQVSYVKVVKHVKTCEARC